MHIKPARRTATALVVRQKPPDRTTQYAVLCRRNVGSQPLRKKGNLSITAALITFAIPGASVVSAVFHARVRHRCSASGHILRRPPGRMPLAWLHPFRPEHTSRTTSVPFVGPRRVRDHHISDSGRISRTGRVSARHTWVCIRTELCFRRACGARQSYDGGNDS